MTMNPDNTETGQYTGGQYGDNSDRSWRRLVPRRVLPESPNTHRDEPTLLSGGTLKNAGVIVGNIGPGDYILRRKGTELQWTQISIGAVPGSISGPLVSVMLDQESVPEPEPETNSGGLSLNMADRLSTVRNAVQDQINKTGASSDLAETLILVSNIESDLARLRELEWTIDAGNGSLRDMVPESSILEDSLSAIIRSDDETVDTVEDDTDNTDKDEPPYPMGMSMSATPPVVESIFSDYSKRYLQEREDAARMIEKYTESDRKYISKLAREMNSDWLEKWTDEE